MKAQTTAGQLRAGLRLLRGIVDRRCTIPVLGTVRASNGSLTATDLDNEVTVTLPTIGDMDGGVCLDWRGLSALASHIDPDEVMTLEEAGGLASIGFNGSSYRMASCPVGDFPALTMADGAVTKARNLGLIAALRRVRFATSREETRYYLNGAALLTGPKGEALVAATDGHRLAMMPIGTMPEGASGAIIWNRTLAWLCNQRQEPESCTFSGVEVVQAEDGKPVTRHPRARFEFAGISLTAKLIDGAFPDIFRVIPSDPQPVFSADRPKLLRVLARIRAFGAGAHGIKLAGSKGELTISFADKFEARDAREILQVDMGERPDFMAGYNINYLLDALRQLRGDKVTFSASGDPGATAPVTNPLGNNPTLITCDDDQLRIVQMPMRL